MQRYNDGNEPAHLKKQPFHALFVRGSPPPAPPPPAPSPPAVPAPARPSPPLPALVPRAKAPPSPQRKPAPAPASTSVLPSFPPLPLVVTLPGGAQGFRAPLLARNWIRKAGGKLKQEHGIFMAILLDYKRIPFPIIESLRRKSGYDAHAHDPVVFFERRGKKLLSNFGATVRGSWSLWNRAAYEVFAQKDKDAAHAFQHFCETEVFEWLECELCGKWRMYPHDDVILPQEGSVFVCDLAHTWNPAIQGCSTEQEFSFDSVTTPAPSSAPPPPPVEKKEHEEEEEEEEKREEEEARGEGDDKMAVDAEQEEEEDNQKRRR